MSPARRWLAAGMFGLVALLLILTSTWEDSPAWDEPEHIMAGYSYLRYGAFFFNPFHPPLSKDLSGLAVMLALDPPHLEGWPKAPKAELIEHLFSHTDPQTLVRVARLPHILLAAAFLSLYFLSIEERHGAKAGALAASLLLMTPLFLAHAGRVHNDVTAAIFTYLSLWLLAGYLARTPSLKSIAPFALVAGAAQTVKFSCLLLYPVYLVAITLCRDRRARWRSVPVTAAVGLLVIWAVYIVHPAPSDFQKRYRKDVFAGQSGPLLEAVEWAAKKPYLRRLSWYATGVLAQSRHFTQGHDYPVFLAGRLYPKGSKLYFPTLVALKTPPAVLLLLLLALAGAARTWDSETRLYALFCGGYFALALHGSLNLGLRHLLPIYPLLFAVAGRALADTLEKGAGPAYRAAVGMGLLSGAVTLALTWPGYLSYFNLAAPRPAPAVDSDYDWGTDLLRLSRRVSIEGWTPITVHYFGSIHPRLYLGPEASLLDAGALPQDGWVAISATHYLPLLAQSRTDKGPEPLWAWIQSLEEVDRVGAFIVFKVPPVDR